MPRRPPEVERSRGSLWSVLLAGLVGLGFFAGLCFILWPLLGVGLGIAIVVGLFCLVAMGHYLLWGRWLGDTIRREVEEEEREAENLSPPRAKLE
jgi:hypothetical protein